MTDRVGQPECQSSAGAAGQVMVVDLAGSGRALLIVDDEFAVEWQIERPGSSDLGSPRYPSLV
jgi:hypothetical protein